VISAAETAFEVLSRIQGTIAGDNTAAETARYVTTVTASVDARAVETHRLLKASGQIGAFQDLAANWTVLRDEAALRASLVNGRLAELDKNTSQVAKMTGLWTLTQQSLQAAQAPADLLARATDVLQQASSTARAISESRGELLTQQSKLADQSARISRLLAEVNQAQGEAMSRLFIRDSQPLWDPRSFAQAGAAAERLSLPVQLLGVGNYLVAERGLVILHLGIWIFLIVLFRRASHRVRGWIQEDPQLAGTTTIFAIPVATATLLALWLAFPLYSGGPALWDAILGAALLAPLILVVRRFIAPVLQPVLWALAAFYFASQVREAAQAFPVVPRLIYFLETMAGLLFSLWLHRLTRSYPHPSGCSAILWRILRMASQIGFLVFAVAGVANLLGYADLALFVGTVALDSAYAGILFYAACHVLDGLLMFAMHTPPLAFLAMVRNHRVLLERRFAQIIRWGATLLWLAFTLDKTALLSPVTDAAAGILNHPLIATVSLRNILVFLLTIWASFLLSRFVRFALEEDVYGRVSLKPGLPFAISTILHYAILLLGFYLAMAALIGDIGKFTILAGAFGVGVGFGLQNIVNNFVSSIIVLFERPVKIGDLVKIGDAQGVVSRIGIRATIIRTETGSEVIIPNGKLISDTVTNWTLSTPQRAVQMTVTIAAAGADPQRVIALLEQTAASLPAVAKAPKPEAVLSAFSLANLSFTLSVWTTEIESTDRVQSDLAIAVNAALAKEGVALV